MKWICFSGLGADQRVFSKLTLNYPIEVVPWISPNRNETIASYCSRLKSTIDLDVTYGFIGVSFGGLIALEMSKVTIPIAVVSISSIVNSKELPWSYRLSGKFNFAKLLPKRFAVPPISLGVKMFDVSNENKNLFAEIINDTDPVFVKWAINVICCWENSIMPCSFYRIHGTKDKMFRPRGVNYDAAIQNGGHFMIVENADEISEAINEFGNTIS